MSDTKIKEKTNLEETKEVKKTRKSYIKKNNSAQDKKLVPTTITFKNADHRMLVTDYYTNIGFTTLNDYIMALVKLSMNDEYITAKLKNITEEY